MKDDLRWLVQELRSLAGDLSDDPREHLLLAIDQGGHASRVIAFDARGAHCAESFTPISTFRSGTDRIEHDPVEIVESIRTALDDLAQTLGSDAERVVAAGLATQRSSVVCWDKRSGKPLSPVLSWQDRRNAGFVERMRDQAASVRAQTGLVLSPHYGASKLRWCLDEIAAVRSARDHKRLALGPLSSYLLYSLLEEHPFAVDPANASRTQLWDPHTRTWSAALAARFGVPLELLPSPTNTRHLFGQFTFAGKQVPLVVCTGDQSAAPFAFGSMDPTTIYINMGTGAFVQRMSDADDECLLRSVSYSDEERLVVTQEGTVNGAAAAIEWLNERVGIDAHCAALALRRSCAHRNPPIFINGVGGVGSPYWKSDLASYFVGASSEAGQVQAVIESIAFLICRNLERMQQSPAQRVLASGGLSSSDYLCECIAALSSLRVERASVREATALGLAFLIAGQPASWQSQSSFETFSPVPDADLSERYARWCQMMDA
jgi:glycerol kinase